MENIYGVVLSTLLEELEHHRIIEDFDWGSFDDNDDQQQIVVVTRNNENLLIIDFSTLKNKITQVSYQEANFED